MITRFNAVCFMNDKKTDDGKENEKDYYKFTHLSNVADRGTFVKIFLV